MTHEEADTIRGMQVIQLLDLKVKENGRVDTTWGDKTPMGLARTIRRLCKEAIDDAEAYEK